MSLNTRIIKLWLIYTMKHTTSNKKIKMTDALHYKDESQKYYIKQENADIQYIRHDSLYKVQEQAKLNYEDEN